MSSPMCTTRSTWRYILVRRTNRTREGEGARCILTTDQSDAASAGIFSRRTNRTREGARYVLTTDQSDAPYLLRVAQVRCVNQRGQRRHVRRVKRSLDQPADARQLHLVLVPQVPAPRRLVHLPDAVDAVHREDVAEHQLVLLGVQLRQLHVVVLRQLQHLRVPLLVHRHLVGLLRANEEGHLPHHGHVGGGGVQRLDQHVVV
eukprot:1179832-Prorocentrum_minimum.AAC.3